MKKMKSTNFNINIKDPSATVCMNTGVHTPAHLQANNQSFYQLREIASIYSTSDLRYVGSRKCHCGCQFTVQPSGIKRRRVVARARRCARQLVVSKGISEADYCLNPFFH